MHFFRRKKPEPPELNEDQRKILAEIEAIAKFLDTTWITVCGRDFGADGIIGFIPVVGDLATAMISLWIFIRKFCRKYRAQYVDLPSLQFLNLCLLCHMSLVTSCRYLFCLWPETSTPQVVRHPLQYLDWLLRGIDTFLRRHFRCGLEVEYQEH